MSAPRYLPKMNGCHREHRRTDHPAVAQPQIEEMANVGPLCATPLQPIGDFAAFFASADIMPADGAVVGRRR